jgi:hypothetical protein
MRRLLVAFVVLLVATPAFAEPRGLLLSGAYAAFVGSQALDIHSTHLGLSRGAVERNPFVGSCLAQVGCAFGVKSMTTAGVLWMVDRHVRPKSRTAAIVTVVALTAVQGAVAARNYRVARGLR